MKRKLSEKVISILLCLNLLVNSFLPLVVYAQNFDPGDGGGSSYDDSTPPAETVPADEPQESVSETTGLTPAPISEETPAPAPFIPPAGGLDPSLYNPPASEPAPTTSSFTPPAGLDPGLMDNPAPQAPQPAPTSPPALDEVITSPTAQERALERYARRAEAMDKYQDEVLANTRADESISGNTITYLPSQITGMVQQQLEKVEEEINKIAENTTPMSREEVLQAQRLERKEEQLNKIAQQQDAVYEAEQKKQRDAIVAVQSMPPEQRVNYLKDQGMIPQDIPTDQVDAKVRAAAVRSGLLIDGNVTSGDFTIPILIKNANLSRDSLETIG